jgi:hypothetical protein
MNRFAVYIGLVSSFWKMKILQFCSDSGFIIEPLFKINGENIFFAPNVSKNSPIELLSFLAINTNNKSMPPKELVDKISIYLCDENIKFYSIIAIDGLGNAGILGSNIEIELPKKKYVPKVDYLKLVDKESK